MEMRYFKFFSYIRSQFGIETCNSLKHFKKLTDQSINLRIRIKFLKECLKLKLVPPHLDICNRYEKFSMFSDGSKKRLKILFFNHVKTVLRLELSDTYQHLITIRNKLFKLYKRIHRLLPTFVLMDFFGYQKRYNREKWANNTTRINKKIEWLVLKNNNKVKKDIKPINYHRENNIGKELNVQKDGCKIEINVSPMNFRLESPLNKIQDKWFVNLCQKTIPNEVISLLQLGKRFSLPSITNNRDKTMIEFIKCIE